jgi:transcriptional regulator with XRE-family HTH domain
MGMAINERIRYIRNLRGATLRWLGMSVGFPERTADIRMAQYESGSRKPKADLTAAIANSLEVAPEALSVPDIDTYKGLIHTLFALEDMYGLKVSEINGEICLTLDKQARQSSSYSLYCDLREWLEISNQLEKGEITKAEYDEWRYNYPKYSSNHIVSVDCSKTDGKVKTKTGIDLLKEKFRRK